MFINKCATKLSYWAGKPIALIAAFLVVLLWAVAGPIMGYSDTWMLVINTTTTIITFLLVFIIQMSQNRDGKAIQAKLDELIHAVEGARDDLEHIEDMDEAQIEELRR